MKNVKLFSPLFIPQRNYYKSTYGVGFNSLTQRKGNDKAQYRAFCLFEKLEGWWSRGSELGELASKQKAADETLSTERESAPPSKKKSSPFFITFTGARWQARARSATPAPRRPRPRARSRTRWGAPSPRRAAPRSVSRRATPP